jgi:hypothetical protein
MEGGIARELRDAVARIRSQVRIDRLVAAVEAGDIDSAMKAMGIRPGSWDRVTEVVRGAYYAGGKATIASDIPKRFGAEFSMSNPRAETWLRQHSTKFITEMQSSQREALQTMLQSGFEAGRGTRNVALDIVGRIDATGRRSGGVIGLSEPQANAVSGMRSALSGSDVGSMLDANGKQVKKFWIGKDGKLKSSYTRRDKRFDATIRKAIESGESLDAATVDKMVGRYSDRMLQLRGETIARAEAQAALHSSADEALLQAIDDGLIPADAAKRIWHHSYAPNERPGHKQMSGQERAPNEPFLNPSTGVQLKHPHDGDAPPSETIGCRCRVEHKIDFAALSK